MGDENSNQPLTLGDYSRPSHEGYRNTIELPEGAKVSPLGSDTIRLVQNGCAFHGLISEDPIQHLKDFLKILDSNDLNGATRNTTHLRLFCFTLRDQAINWLDRLPAGSISTWDDLITRFLAQFFLPERTAKLRNDILMFQQHQGESLYDAWNRFKDLLRKVPHHGLDLWLQVQIFYDHVNHTTQMAIDDAADGRLRKLRPEEAWKTIEDLAQYEEEEWNKPESPDYIDATLEQELESMECRVKSLMRNEVLLEYEVGFTFPKRAYQEELEVRILKLIDDQEDQMR
ncbi:zinc finger, CCHC-type containing protein [Tanacetum coccineum]